MGWALFLLPSSPLNQRLVHGLELTRHYFKIPYIGYFSGVTQQRVPKLINRFCKPIDIKSFLFYYYRD